MQTPAAGPGSSRRVGPFLAGLGLAAAFIALSAGSALGSLGVEAGVALAPWDSELQRRAAIAALGRGDEAAAQRFALRSIDAMPFNQSSLTIASLGATGPRAVEATNVAAGLGWRDPMTNALLVAAAMNERAPEIAAQRIDAIGRISEDSARTGQMADRLLAMPGGTEALADRAAHHLGRGWIPDWLRTPPASPKVAAARVAFLRLLESDDGTWNRQVIGQAMTGFTAAGDSATAFAAWRDSIAQRDLFSGQIYDPRFMAIPEGQPIGGEWIVGGGPLVSTDAVPSGGLRIDALAGASGQVVSQMVSYGAGRHELVANLTGDEALVQAFRWQAMCVSGGRLAVERSLTRNADGWRDSYAFDVPQGCSVGFVGLTLPAPLSGDRSATVLSVTLNSRAAAR